MQRIIYIIKRTKELGFINTYKRINARSKKKIYYFLWKKAALNRTASHSWKQIKNKHNLKISFEDFLNKIKDKQFVQNNLNLHTIKSSNQTVFNDLAKKIKNQKNILNFYQDIQIEQKKCNSFDEYYFDIKVPWESSRFQGNITKAKISDWIEQNPYLLGVNWVCPMEVAIRAFNWIYWFYNNATNIDIDLAQQLICSLYDHAIYLQNNWETSDKPNNHYLADLIGYFYLCFFFDDLTNFEKQKHVTYKKILNQFDHQIQDDGTSYEGSTNYHKLVTEMFTHFYLLCTNNNISLPKSFLPKFKKMHLFLEHCKDSNGNLVQIGDNDSGRILRYTLLRSIELRRALRMNVAIKTNLNNTVRPRLCAIVIGRRKRSIEDAKSNGSCNNIDKTRSTPSQRLFAQGERIKKSISFLQNPPPPPAHGECSPSNAMVNVSNHHYPNFGLTIIKNNSWHITYRHPTYKHTQPSGHFHQDDLSITVSYNGMPILVDPGTYVYTANTKWRNLFRSYKMHNTFYLKDNLKNLDNIDLFQLPKTQQQDTAKIVEKDNFVSIENYTKSSNNLNKFRKIIFNNEFLEIRDWFTPSSRLRHTSPCTGSANDSLKKECCWNLIFHPNIKIKNDNNNFIIYCNEKKLLKMESNLDFKSQDGVYSSGYGKIKKCLKLEANQKIDRGQILILFKKI